MQSENRHLNKDFSEPEFFAELTPHRSLGRTGFIILMCFIGGSCFISGMMFLIMGAWPVLFFLALDALIVWGAFQLNYRAARKLERISIWPDQLLVQKFEPNGKVDEHQFNPFWARFEVKRHEEIGITSMQITSRKRRLDIGTFLNPDDRESFALAFANALGRAKRA